MANYQMNDGDRVSVPGYVQAVVALTPFDGPTDRLTVLAPDTGPRWTVVTMHPMPRKLSFTVRTFPTSGALGRYVEDHYGAGAWATLLDHLIEDERVDDELRRAWAVTRIELDFAALSFFDRDLSQGGMFGDPTPAVGRQLPGWEERALHLMAAGLANVGFDVLEVGGGGTANVFGSPAVGTLHVAAYGFRLEAVVRVDAAGEVFVRLPDGPDGQDPADLLTPYESGISHE